MRDYKEKEEDIVLSLKNVSKTFYISDAGAPLWTRVAGLITGKSQRKLPVISGLNLEVRKGEFIGIIGRNGSGKSTLLKMVMGAIKCDKGAEIHAKGKMIRLALGMGFDPNLTARDNIYLNGTILGLTFKEIGERFEELIDFSELHDFVDTPIRFYSSGMKSRLSFAVAVNADADIFLIDEFFGAVGDNAFKEKSQKAFEENILRGKTILHVSHSMDIIKKHCDRVLLLHNGTGTVYNNPEEATKMFKKIGKKGKSLPKVNVL